MSFFRRSRERVINPGGLVVTLRDAPPPPPPSAGRARLDVSVHTAEPEIGPVGPSGISPAPVLDEAPATGAVCFSCGNPIQGESIPLNATAFRAAPGYGSDHDGEGELDIHVCDTCLTERRDRVSRLHVTRSTRVRREAWRP